MRPCVNEDVWQAFSEWQVPTLASGQVWRLCWNEDCSIAVIFLHGEGDSFTAFPVAEDVQFATNYDLVLQSHESSLDMPLMIQVALETGIGRFVLERCVATISDSAKNDVAKLRASFTVGEPSNLPLGRVGAPLTNELDERLHYRAEQREMFAAFSLAEWMEPVQNETVAVGDLIGKKITKSGASVALKEMNEATGIPVKDLVRLWRHEGATLDEKQAIVLADFLDVEHASLIASLSGEAPPQKLIEVMNEPTHKPRFYHYSQEWQMDEAQTRRRVARTLIATRKRARELSALDWERLLKEHFPL